MTRRAALFAVLCGIASTGASAGCQDKQLAALDLVRAEVCACKTPVCAQSAMLKLPTTDIESDHRTQTVAREMMDCLAKIDEAAQAKQDEDPDAGSGSGSDDAPGSSGSAAGSGSATRP